MNKKELDEKLTQYRIDVLKEVDKINKNVSEEIGNLLDQLDKKIKAIEEPEPESKSKRWKPKESENKCEFGEDYWLVCANGEVASYHWDNSSFDNQQYLTGNCFKTEEEAEEHAKEIEYTARYKNYIEEHSEPIDWENREQLKYCPEYGYIGKEIKIYSYNTWKYQGTIYASSEEIIWDAIKKIGEDNFKKYVLGVK